jgi:hypothetical protein
MDLSGDDARPRPIPPGQAQKIHLTLDPVQINVMQGADPQVLKKLDDLLEAIKALGADRAQLAQITGDLKTHTDALKAAVAAAKT